MINFLCILQLKKTNCGLKYMGIPKLIYKFIFNIVTSISENASGVFTYKNDFIRKSRYPNSSLPGLEAVYHPFHITQMQQYTSQKVRLQHSYLFE